MSAAARGVLPTTTEISYFSPPSVRSGLQTLQAGFPQSSRHLLYRQAFDMQGGMWEYEVPADASFPSKAD
jgi:hypothetical protein